MDPLTLIIGASGSWAIKKSLDGSLRGLSYIRRGICKDLVKLKFSKSAFLRLVGEVAELGANDSKDSEFRNAIIAKLSVSQNDLENIWQELQDSSAWQAEAGMDLIALLQGQAGFRRDLSNILAQLKEIAGQENTIAPASIDAIATHVATALKLGPIKDQVGEIHGILTGGLISPLHAWTRYWERMRAGGTVGTLEFAGRACHWPACPPVRRAQRDAASCAPSRPASPPPRPSVQCPPPDESSSRPTCHGHGGRNSRKDEHKN